MTWALYTQDGTFLPPLPYSNGKTQEDIVQEILKAIRAGHKLIFVHGVCGTGKSAIALHVASVLGSASIVVPVKVLQKQYEHDYSEKLYLLKENKQRLEITVITGRNNHHCLYHNKKVRADDPFLPCNIEIKEEHFPIIKAFLCQNKKLNLEDFKTIEDVKRMSVAPLCPYWSPILPSEAFPHVPFSFVSKHAYEAIGKKPYTYFQRKEGCSYYMQFQNYLHPEVLIFNSQKYLLETLIGRKPATAVEIIDECDEFLDALSNEKRINLNFLQHKCEHVKKTVKDPALKECLDEIKAKCTYLLSRKWIGDVIQRRDVLPLEKSGIHELFEIFLNNEKLAELEDFEYYYEIALYFKNMLKDSYVSFYMTGKQAVVARIVNINLQAMVQQLTEVNTAFVFLSGTLHTPNVLRDIFGLKDFVVIEAETKPPGTVHRIATGREKNFRYKEFAEGRVTREEYLLALDACVRTAKKPFLVHVNSYNDLPTEEEKKALGLIVQSQEKLRELQQRYKTGELLHLFKEGKLEVLYSTTCSRGVDLPGKMCNSIIFTKYPFPSMDDVFWRVLKEQRPRDFMEFYFDKARRAFLQRVFRGLRSRDDEVTILSPDTKALYAPIGDSKQSEMNGNGV